MDTAFFKYFPNHRGLSFHLARKSKLFGFPPAPPEMMMLDSLPAILVVTAVLEFFGGLLTLVGLLTRPTAFILSGLMAVAYFRAHGLKAFLPIQNGGETAVLYCFVFLFLSVAGGVNGVWID